MAMPMPPGDGVAVTPADMVSHADHVETVAAGVAAARQAGAATAPGPEAYGKLCVIVPLLLGQLQGMVVDGIAAAEQSLHDTAERLRTAAAAYRDADERSATAIRRAGPQP
jgi:Excreted virulence factor EspC, type VII ESX diderm